MSWNAQLSLPCLMAAVAPVLIDSGDCGGVIFSTHLLAAQAQRLDVRSEVLGSQRLFAVLIVRSS